MSDAQRGVIRELAAALDNDSLRGGATRELLAVRRAAVDEAAAARQTYAYRQALLELAACGGAGGADARARRAGPARDAWPCTPGRRIIRLGDGARPGRSGAAGRLAPVSETRVPRSPETRLVLLALSEEMDRRFTRSQRERSAGLGVGRTSALRS
jgi:hypothetical protein